MSPITRLVKGGIMPSGNKHGTDIERMKYWQKIWARSGFKNQEAERNFEKYKRLCGLK